MGFRSVCQPKLTVLPLLSLQLLSNVARNARMTPLSISAFLIHSGNLQGTQPIFAAMDVIAAYCDGYSFR